MPLCITAIESFANFINIDKMMKRIQTANQEMKTINIADDTTIFLRDITCLNMMQVILKLYEMQR